MMHWTSPYREPPALVPAPLGLIVIDLLTGMTSAGQDWRQPVLLRHILLVQAVSMPPTGMLSCLLYLWSVAIGRVAYCDPQSHHCVQHLTFLYFVVNLL